MTTTHPMANSILLLQRSHDQASSRARGLRTMEDLNRYGSKPGDTMYRMADMRAQQAAEMEVLAADYRRALRHLLHIALTDASVTAQYCRERGLHVEADGLLRLAADYRAAHDALDLPTPTKGA